MLLELRERIQPIWRVFEAEAGLSGGRAGVTHLALALLLEPAIQHALQPLPFPDPDRLRKALTGVDPPDLQLHEEDVEKRGGLIVGKTRYWSVDPRIDLILESALESNSLLGLSAQIRILGGLLQEQEVTDQLEAVFDIEQLQERVNCFEFSTEKGDLGDLA